MRKILVIMPAFNEEGRIGVVLENIKKQAPYADILVINDGSKDKTEEEAEKHGADVVSLPFNLGYGAALETGYKYAVESGYEYLAQIDSDGQHDASYIARLLDPIKTGKADISIGSRFLENSGYKAPFVRRLGMIIFASITSLIMRQKITDSTSGFQAMNAKVAKFFTDGTYPSDYPDSDVLIRLYFAGFKITEIPVMMYSYPNQKSMHSGIIKPMYYIFKMCISIFLTLISKKQKA